MNTCRRAVVLIDRIQLKSMDTFHLGEAIQSLPDETKIISLGEMFLEGQFSILIENPSFKEVPEAEAYPRLYITKDNDGYLEIDCSSVLIQEEVNYKAFGPYETSYTPEELDLTMGILNGEGSGNDLLRGFNIKSWSQINGNPVFFTSGGIYTLSDTDVSIFGMSSDYKTYHEINKEVVASYEDELNNIANKIAESQKLFGTPKITLASPCDHVRKTYEGIIDKYDYCEKCDNRL